MTSRYYVKACIANLKRRGTPYQTVRGYAVYDDARNGREVCRFSTRKGQTAEVCLRLANTWRDDANAALQ